MRDRRTLVAADITDAGLQQRLGDGQNAFAPKCRAAAQAQRLDFSAERTFHEGLRAWTIPSLPLAEI